MEAATATVNAEARAGGDSGYAPPGVEQPLGSYAALAALFNLLFAAFLLVDRRSRRGLPDRIELTDVVLLGLATQKLSRMLAKEKVMAFLRAPFTRYQEPGMPGELEEKPRGSGVRKAIGELLVCPSCLSQWVAACFVYGLALAPRVTRTVAAVFAVRGVSDFLQRFYRAAAKTAE